MIFYTPTVIIEKKNNIFTNEPLNFLYEEILGFIKNQ